MWFRCCWFNNYKCVSAAISFGFIYSVGIIYEQIRSNDVRFHNVENNEFVIILPRPMTPPPSPPQAEIYNRMLLIEFESVLALSALFFWPFQAQKSKGHVIFTKVWISSWENHFGIQERPPYLACSSGNCVLCPVGHFSDESLCPGMLTLQ